MAFSGWVGTVAGWYVAEIGRQPWLVHGVLRTADAVGEVAAPLIAGSLAMYLALYVALLTAYVATVFRLAAKAGEDPGPLPSSAATPTGAPSHA
jgi:cytochrome d ubiquinol oxidase subunit I